MDMALAPRLSSLKWVGWSVLAGVASPVVMVATGFLSFLVSWPLRFLFPSEWSPVLVIVALGAAPVIALSIVPFLALRPHWSWWPASLAGSIIGLVGGFIVLQEVFGITIFCFPMSGGAARICDAAVQRSIPWNGLELVAPLAVMGVLQALTVRGVGRKAGWFVTSVVGAFAFVYGLFGIDLALGGTSTRQTYVWLAVLLAGGLWGVVVGIGLTFLSGGPPRRQPTAAAA